MLRALLFLFIALLAACTPRNLSENDYDVSFPIEFIAESGLPKTTVEIEGSPYSLMIDLGSSDVLSLSSEILAIIHAKTPLEETYFVDIKGNEYKTERFLIPEIKLGRMRAYKITVTEESYDFLTDGSLIGHHQRPKEEIAKAKPGSIGRGLFEKNTNLFLDFHNGIVYGCNKLDNRKKNGYQIQKMVSVPFELNHRSGIVLQAKTDFGIKRFMLDTGASRCLLKPSSSQEQMQFYQSSLFRIGKKEFGPQEFLLFEIDSSFDNIDGIIGMDFLKEHVIYLDFKKKLAHIGKASEVSMNRGVN